MANCKLTMCEQTRVEASLVCLKRNRFRKEKQREINAWAVPPSNHTTHPLNPIPPTQMSSVITPHSVTQIIIFKCSRLGVNEQWYIMMADFPSSALDSAKRFALNGPQCSAPPPFLCCGLCWQDEPEIQKMFCNIFAKQNLKNKTNSAGTVWASIVLTCCSEIRSLCSLRCGVFDLSFTFEWIIALIMYCVIHTSEYSKEGNMINCETNFGRWHSFKGLEKWWALFQYLHWHSLLHLHLQWDFSDLF